MIIPQIRAFNIAEGINNMALYINIFRTSRTWAGMEKGDLFTQEHTIYNRLQDAVDEAEAFSDEYEYTIKQDGGSFWQLDLRRGFSDEYCEKYEHDIAIDRKISEGQE